MQISENFPGTIPRTFVLGGGKFVFILRKCTKTLLKNWEFFPGTIPRTFILGEEGLFSLSESVLKFSYSNEEFKKILGDNTPDPRFKGEESLFSFSDNVPKFSYSHEQNSNKTGGVIIIIIITRLLYINMFFKESHKRMVSSNLQ